MGFFSESEVESLDPRSLVVPQCGRCKLHKTCTSPKMPVTGEGRRGILVVAEAPGRNEDREGVQLIGSAGQELRDHLSAFDADLDRDCWKTNAVICRPPENKMREEYIDYCRPTVLKTVEELNPTVVVLLGKWAVRSFIGHEYRKSVGEIGTWVGWQIPLQSRNMWVCPTWHPSYVMRESKNKALAVWFRRHLESAFELKGRPWKVRPDFSSQVEIELSTSVAAKRIRQYSREFAGQPISFDYECDRLKPDHPDAKIVSCAICWAGKKTLAYLFAGKAIEATSEVLKSGVPKIGCNIKFEERWSWRVLGHGVNNWYWDIMEAAHVLDCRPKITSAKFQGFVLLGQPLWSQRVEKYLEEKAGNKANRIHECPKEDLLLYNGMDSVVEYKTAVRQMRREYAS